MLETPFPKRHRVTHKGKAFRGGGNFGPAGKDGGEPWTCGRPSGDLQDGEGCVGVRTKDRSARAGGSVCTDAVRGGFGGHWGALFLALKPGAGWGRE